MTFDSDGSTEGGKPKTMQEVSDRIRSASAEVAKAEEKKAAEKEKDEPGGEGHIEPDGDEPTPIEEPIAPEPTEKSEAELEENPQEVVNEEVVKAMT